VKSIKIKAVDKKPPEVEKMSITITNPSPDTTVSSKTITVSGTSSPTKSVNIYLNKTKVTLVPIQTDASGAFSKEIKDLRDGENEIYAEVLSGTTTVAGTSPIVKVKYSTETPKITSLTIKEGDSGLIGSTINLTAIGDPALKVVIIKFSSDSKTAVLEEDKTKPGTYIGKFKTSDFV
jgi:bacillopeptidase F